MTIAYRLRKLARPVVVKFPALAATYRYIRDHREILAEPKDTPMGFKLMGAPAMEQGTFEPAETEIVKRILPKIDVFVNVGANVGYYCCFALQAGKQTLAFEPIEANLRCLYKNIKANRWERLIEVFPLALSNRAGLITFYGGGTAASLVKGWAGQELEIAMVPVSTMDNVVGSRFSGKSCFIVVDIEGAERLFLEGASSMLSRRPKPIWMVEIAVSDCQPKGIAVNPHLLSTFQTFWDRGYEAWTADEQLRGVGPAEVDRVFRTGKDTLRARNFLFVEKGRKHDFLDG